MDIDNLLEQARTRATNIGQMYGEKETADDYLKLTYALLYEDCPEGSVAERDAWVRRQPDYKAAIDRKKDAYAKWKAAESYLKALYTEIDVWRTREANDRWLNKAHT